MNVPDWLSTLAGLFACPLADLGAIDGRADPSFAAPGSCRSSERTQVSHPPHAARRRPGHLRGRGPLDNLLFNFQFSIFNFQFSISSLPRHRPSRPVRRPSPPPLATSSRSPVRRFGRRRFLLSAAGLLAGPCANDPVDRRAYQRLQHARQHGRFIRPASPGSRPAFWRRHTGWVRRPSSRIGACSSS